MIQQAFDEHDSRKWDEAVEEQRRRNAWTEFLKDNPDYHMSIYNGTMLQDRLAQLKKPVTRRNLGIVYEELTELNLLQKPWKPSTPVAQPKVVDKRASVQHMENTVIVRHSVEDTPENRRALLAEISDRRALGGDVGADPRKTELGRQHRLIKAANIQHKAGSNDARLEAVAAVNLAHPNIKRHSPEFNRLVYEHMQQ
jgi:hypothetical protein